MPRPGPCNCCSPPGPCEAASISVWVKRAGDFENIEGASVTVTRDSDSAVVASGETASSGIFEADLDPAYLGGHTVAVSKYCYIGETAAATIGCGGNAVNVFLGPDPDCVERCVPPCPPGTLFGGATLTLVSGFGIYTGDASTIGPTGIGGGFAYRGVDNTVGSFWKPSSSPFDFGGYPISWQPSLCWESIELRYRDEAFSPDTFLEAQFCQTYDPVTGECPFETNPPICPTGGGSQVYVRGDYQVRLDWGDGGGGGGMMMMAAAPMGATGAPAGPGLAELQSNATACPHSEVIPPEERAGCGCRLRCLAGKGNRMDGKGTDIRNCWDCPLAPRRGGEAAGQGI